MPRCFMAVCLILSGTLVCPVTNAQTNKTFPTDDEITLVVTQTERALSDYEASVKMEEKLAGQAADVENDKRVIKGMTVMVKALRQHPQGFNSPVGFEFVLLLDDASRNAALCNADAIQTGMKVIRYRQSDLAIWLAARKVCVEVGTQ